MNDFAVPHHGLGTRARVLLTSIFGPYAQDDEHGSRAINPMELYHNQVTRVQRGFSIRMFHRSFGLMMLHANIEAPCTLLDFPTLQRFIEELEQNPYDIVGISSIHANIGKVRTMCNLVRKILPEATIVIGGHLANRPGLETLIDADHIVKGDGVRWFRRFLGQDENAPVRHPLVSSAVSMRVMGMPISTQGGDTAATLIPSVGCPMGCNFCSTSAMFGGKGNHVNFYETGDELFSVMKQIEESMKVRSFFILDENFLLYRSRALRLLELMERDGKSWSLYVFSSGRVLKSYSIEQLVGLGVSWVWMGLEGEDSPYAKLNGVDTQALVAELQSHGIHVLGSSIIGMEEHTPENIEDVIHYAVDHKADFHQFMLYTPVPGTELYGEHKKAGTLMSDEEIDPADTHGQFRFNFRHPHIPDGSESYYLVRAFEQDFKANGPSVVRIAWTTLQGWLRYKNHPDPRIRERVKRQAAELRSSYAGALWAAWKSLKSDRPLSGRIRSMYREICREFGLRARLLGPVFGRVLRFSLKREEKRLARGLTYEPPTFYEKNPGAAALDRAQGKSSVTSSVAP